MFYWTGLNLQEQQPSLRTREETKGDITHYLEEGSGGIGAVPLVLWEAVERAMGPAEVPPDLC